MDNYDFIEKFVNEKELYKKHGNLSAEGNRLYSYTTCIAEKAKDTNGKDIMIVSDDTFSMTTARHLNILRSKCVQTDIRMLRLPQRYNSDVFYRSDVIEKIEKALIQCNKEGVSRMQERETIINNYRMLESTLKIDSYNKNPYWGGSYSDHVNKLLDQYRDLYNKAQEKERARIERYRSRYN